MLWYDWKTVESYVKTHMQAHMHAQENCLILFSLAADKYFLLHVYIISSNPLLQNETLCKENSLYQIRH